MKKRSARNFLGRLVLSMLVFLTACGPASMYRDPNMDFGSIYTVAVMPFVNLTREPLAADRVRDVFSTMLLASGDVYVIPQGEVARGLALAGVTNATSPSVDEFKKIGTVLKSDAVITGVIREYGEVRSGSAAANVLSMHLQMTEVQTGKIVWSMSVSKGGISMSDRLFGGGGEPMNDITEKAVKDVISQLFK